MRARSHVLIARPVPFAPRLGDEFLNVDFSTALPAFCRLGTSSSGLTTRHQYPSQPWIPLRSQLDIDGPGSPFLSFLALARLVTPEGKLAK